MTSSANDGDDGDDGDDNDSDDDGEDDDGDNDDHDNDDHDDDDDSDDSYDEYDEDDEGLQSFIKSHFDNHGGGESVQDLVEIFGFNPCSPKCLRKAVHRFEQSR